MIATAACGTNSGELSDARTSFVDDAAKLAIDAPSTVIDGNPSTSDGHTADASDTSPAVDGNVDATASMLDAVNTAIDAAATTPDATPDAAPLCAAGTYSQATYAGVGAYGIAVGDFDHQGGPDLVTVPNTSDSVMVLLNSGTGTFPTTATYHTGSGTTIGVAVSDFNQDGWDDFAVTDQVTNNIAVFLNAQDGTFLSPTLYAQTGTSNFVAAGDLNGDGYPDLAAPNSAAKLSVFFNNHDGTFGTEQTYAVGPGSEDEGVAIADFNNDGSLDVVVGNLDANAVGILLNQGEGVLGAQTNYPGGRPMGVAVGDFNNDGWTDVVSEGWFGDSTADVWLNDGTGSGELLTKNAFTVPGTPPEVAVGDLDGDGNLDFVVTNYSNSSISIFNGDGLGGFTQQSELTITGGTGPIGIAIADFNGDNVLDIAVSNADSGTTSVLTGCGSP